MDLLSEMEELSPTRSLQSDLDGNLTLPLSSCHSDLWYLHLSEGGR